MASDIAVFSYLQQDVRTVMIDGAVWFVARDVCAILGISNSRDALARLDEDGVGTADIIDSLRRPQGVGVINEAGLYELIFQSRRPEAKQFRKWVTSVVLPQIRQTGTYSASPEVEVPHDFLSALEALVLREKQNLALAQQNAELAPRADAWNALASAEGDYSVGDAAKILARANINTGPTRLFAQLAAINWTFRGGDGKWRAYAERVEKGYLAERPQWHYHPRTQEKVMDPPQLRITVKGLERLRHRLHTGVLMAVVSA